MTTTPRVTIVGAGIGGLTLALALRRHGIEAQLFEQTAQLREVGAAVALSANATRFYEGRLELGTQFAEKWFEVQALVYRDGRSGEVIAKHEGGSAYRDRFSGPYAGIHRADLQVILSQAVGMENIHLNKRVLDVQETSTEAVLTFADGTTEAADLVIGADGARSTIRRLMLGYDDALYSGCSGFRGIVPADLLSQLPDPDAIQFWMGPGGHLLHYPIGNGDHNFLLVERDPNPWPYREWVAPSCEGEQLKRFADWHPAVVQMISAVPISPRWGLFHRPPLGRWTKGRITLMGDAAHALVPHHGQGANQSIEDAIVLADCLAGSSDPDAARAEYERLRRGRTRKVQYASITTADVLHLPDSSPRAAERNARLADPAMFDRHLGWIHDFAADSEEPSERSGGTWL